MAEYVSIGYKLEAAAGAEGDITLFTVPGAQIFKLTDITIRFPSGQNFQLELSLYRGAQKIAPYKGVYCGDALTLRDKSSRILQSQERLILHYKNNDAANPQAAFILVGGCLE